MTKKPNKVSVLHTWKSPTSLWIFVVAPLLLAASGRVTGGAVVLLILAALATAAALTVAGKLPNGFEPSNGR